MEENEQKQDTSSENVKSKESTGRPRSQTAQENSAATSGEQSRQMHENRENPEKDHVPGHMGYNRQEHQIDVNPTRDEDDIG